MKSRFLLLTLSLLLFAGSAAQTLGEFKPKDQSYGLGKLKNVKRIFISGFDVNFQVYNEKEKFKQGGSMLGGGVKGDAKTAISVGLEGLDAKTVQEITDKLYADYIGKLKAKGLTVISADEAAKTETYEDYIRQQGGNINMAQIPGVITSVPTGFEYFAKNVKKDGKVKKGGFLGNEAMLYPRLSRDLGDAIIGKVDITVLFVSDKGAFQGNGAKLKIATNLRLISTEGVIMTNDASFKLKGSNTVTPVSSTVAFYHGKMGAGPTTAYIGTLGKALSIGGVIDETTVTSYAAGSRDATGSSTIYGTFYSAANSSTETTKVIPVDAAKYGAGVYAAAKKFLDFHTDEFLKSF